MEAAYRTEQLTEATAKVAEARHAYEIARTAKARREAAEDLEFWSNRTAFLSHAR
jgi:hypothetical protein